MGDRTTTSHETATGKQKTRNRLGRGAAMVLIAGLPLLGACSNTVMRPIISKHGYIPDAEKIAALEPGVTTKSVARATLGTPSSMATFDQDTWYYISSTQESFAFLDKEVTDREVLAVRFDKTGLLSTVETYGMEDGKVINYVSRKTPTRGKELTFLEQMFGNVGRGLPGGIGGDQGGPGGPGR